MVHTATLLRGLVAGLLLLTALLAFSGTGQAAAAGAVTLPPALAELVKPGAPDKALASAAPAETTEEVMSGNTAKPCKRRAARRAMAGCLTLQSMTIFGGLPVAAVAIPAPKVGSIGYVAIPDDPARGIAVLPDVPPPRPLA